jgi:hypothetical protein
MKLFVDNDIAVKMAQWGLLQRLHLHMTKQGGAELYVVPTLRWKFKLAEPAKAAALLGSTAAAKQLTEFADLCKPAKGHNQQVASALASVPQVDAGEATLFAAAANFDGALIDTGDKKALRALGRFGGENLVTKALWGRVACLEQTMHYLVGRWTYGPVHKAVLSAPHADKTTFRCFDGQPEHAALAALDAKVEELRPECAGTLATSPFSWIA